MHPHNFYISAFHAITLASITSPATFVAIRRGQAIGLRDSVLEVVGMTAGMSDGNHERLLIVGAEG